MKTSIYSLVAATLLQIAAASPHREFFLSMMKIDANSIGQHAQFHEKRAVVHTEVQWVTQTVEDTVVYLDENGRPYSTGIERTAPTPAAVNPAPIFVAAKPTPQPIAPANPQPVVPPVKEDIPEAMKHPHVDTYPKQPLGIAQAPSVPAAAPIIAPAAPPSAQIAVPFEYTPEFTERYATAAAGMSRSDGYGVSWTPFQGEEAAVTCKPQDQTNEEFSKMASMQFTTVRVYGVACNQIVLAMRGAADNGLRVMLGVFDLSNVAGETQDLIRQVQTTGLGWGMVDTISIGNEDVQKGAASADAVIAAVTTARSMLRGAGYQGPVVHVETHGAILANPQLCSEAAGDYIAANIHPFFNPLIISYFAGKYVKSQVRALQDCSAQQSRKRSEHRVVVTETGWPTSGWPNGLAIPSRGQQFAAIKSIKRELENDVYLFSAFDNRWQRDSSGTFGAEKHWGLLMD
jgi:exo-beta-1,3-glucanase (GH17 family)